VPTLPVHDLQAYTGGIGRQEEASMRSYLVVSNQTLGGAALAAKVRSLLEEGDAEFHIVVPATARGRFSWTEGQARAIAQERLDAALRWFSSMGATATGETADEHPLYAIRDALRDHEIDEIIISTLPPGMSRWLRQDLPRKVRKEFGLPVTHVVGEAARTSKTA
jgi:hypothetical protein